MQLISLALMEHKVLTLCRNRPNEIEAELLFKKSVSAEPDEAVLEVDIQLKKSLSSSKQIFKRQVTPQDEFEVNLNFRSGLKRIAINAIQKKESRKDSERIFDLVIKDRKFLIDAAIVKLLKSKRQLSYRDLVREVMGLVRFPLEVSQLNQRIESLRESEYLIQQDLNA